MPSSPRITSRKGPPSRNTTRAAGIRKLKAKRVGIRKQEPQLLETLKALSIPVYVGSDLEYERSVACSNLLYRFQRPALVVQPQNVGHVQSTITQAKLRNIPITIKNGGHSYSGSSFPDDGILLDMKHMHEISLDNRDANNPEYITVQGGAIWGQVYRTLVNAGLDGKVVNGGRCPTVGVSGFMLGGGLGPFSRSLGMGVDSLLEISIVTANGELVVARATDDLSTEEGMLFWALCGGGSGSFGVVVELKMKVHSLHCGTSSLNGFVTAGRHTWYPPFRTDHDHESFLRTMNRFYTKDWVERMTIDSTWFSDTGMASKGALAVRFLPYYDGNQIDFNSEIHLGIMDMKLLDEMKRRVMPEKSTRFLHETLFAQWDEETKRSGPGVATFRLASSFSLRNDETTIENVTRICKTQLERFKEKFQDDDALLQVTFIHCGGQMGRRPRGATAFRWRDCAYQAYIMTTWKDKFIELDMRTLMRQFKEQLRPYSITGKAAFAGFSDVALGRGDAMKAYYGNNRQLLQQAKRIWDADNYFQWGQSIALPDPAATLQGAQEMIHDQEEMLSDEEVIDDEELTDLAAQSGWDIRTNTPRFERLTHSGPPQENEQPDSVQTPPDPDRAFVFYGDDVRMSVRMNVA